MEQILKFIDLLQQYRTIERRVLIKNADRSENDTEHSYSLAMLGWYINEVYKLGLNKEKIFLYALAHDLVEVYAGDTFFYQTDVNAFQEKHKKEKAAAQRLKQEFPEFTELHAVIEDYEKRTDEESKFVYALDKIEPVLHIYQDKGRTWKKDGVTLDMLTSMKLSKVAVHSTIEQIFKELVERLASERGELFNA